jgi:hypothetical protein
VRQVPDFDPGPVNGNLFCIEQFVQPLPRPCYQSECRFRPKLDGLMGNEIIEVRDELIVLFQKQLDALELDTYVGLTDEEWRAYGARHDRIRELRRKLSEFQNSSRPKIAA